MLDDQLAFEFLEPWHYHDPARWGWFSLLVRPPAGGATKQRSYPLSRLSEVIQYAPKDRDTFLSQAEFSKPNRRLVNLRQVGLCWADLDLYHSDFSGLGANQIDGLVRQHCDDLGLPAPSIIIYSGRGAHCKWILDRPVPALALPRWNAVQQRLAEVFAPLGADRRACDGSRVLRLVNTINVKTGEECRVLWEQQQDGLLVRHDFDALAREVLPLDRQECREKTKAKKGAALALVGGTERSNAFTIKTLHWNRLADIRTVVKLRGWSEPIPGYQDTCLFLAACALSWSVAPSRLWQEIEQLALEFCPRWQIDEARAVLSTLMDRARLAAEGHKIEWRGQKLDPRYRFKNQTIIDLLGITSDEQRHLLTLIDECEQRRRDRLWHEKARRKAGMIERGDYLASVEDRRQRAIVMSAQGMTQGAIAEMLNVDRTTVYRWLHKRK